MSDKQTAAAPTSAPKAKAGPSPAALNSGGADGGDGAGVSSGGGAASSGAGTSSRAGHVVAAGSGGRSAEDAARERAALLQPTAGGPGSGSRLVTQDGDPIESATSAIDSEAETIVTLKDDVYEEHPAPGAPNRKIRKLLYHKGERVPKSKLAQHDQAAEGKRDEHEHLASLGRGTGHPDDADLAETKEGTSRSGTPKEGGRRVPAAGSRRSSGSRSTRSR